jgi:hypothetical protein
MDSLGSDRHRSHPLFPRISKQWQIFRFQLAIQRDNPPQTLNEGTLPSDFFNRIGRFQSIAIAPHRPGTTVNDVVTCPWLSGE